MVESSRYRFAKGFSSRREPFGGILYHYAGVRPDPNVYFVDSPFLMDLLEVLREHPETPLGELIDAAVQQFDLNPGELEAVTRFFSTLTEGGALVQQ